MLDQFLAVRRKQSQSNVDAFLRRGEAQVLALCESYQVSMGLAGIELFLHRYARGYGKNLSHWRGRWSLRDDWSGEQTKPCRDGKPNPIS